ncbi:hypothetical protein Tco_1073630, partial [Tanacetum coccineum]
DIESKDKRESTNDKVNSLCANLEESGATCDESLKADNTNADVIHCKVSHVDDSTNLNVDESTMSSDPIVQSVDINTKLKSYAGAAGASAKDQPKVNSNFRPLVADPVFDGVNISIPRKVIEKSSGSCVIGLLVVMVSLIEHIKCEHGAVN